MLSLCCMLCLSVLFLCHVLVLCCSPVMCYVLSTVILVAVPVRAHVLPMCYQCVSKAGLMTEAVVAGRGACGPSLGGD